MLFKIRKIKQNSIERECAKSCSTQKDVELEKAVGGSVASVVIVSVSLFSCYEAEERRPANTSALLIAMC